MLFLDADGTVQNYTSINRQTGGVPAIDEGDGFGISAAAIADRDGDGVRDLAVGALFDDTGGIDRGAIYLVGLNSDGTLKKGPTIDFTVTRRGDTSQSSTVAYATANETAIAGSDYVAASGIVEFLPGETSKMISVQVIGDTQAGRLADREFVLSLARPSGATISDGVAVGTARLPDSPSRD